MKEKRKMEFYLLMMPSEKPMNTGLANVSPIFLTKKDGDECDAIPMQ